MKLLIIKIERTETDFKVIRVKGINVVEGGRGSLVESIA